MSDVYSLFEQEAADPQAFKQVREGDTKSLSSLIRRSVELDQQIKDTEAQLKDLQQKKRSVDEEDIPSLMETMGVESLQVDGNKVTVDKTIDVYERNYDTIMSTYISRLAHQASVHKNFPMEYSW